MVWVAVQRVGYSLRAGSKGVGTGTGSMRMRACHHMRSTLCAVHLARARMPGSGRALVWMGFSRSSRSKC